MCSGAFFLQISIAKSAENRYNRVGEKPFSRKGVERMDLFDLIGPVMIGPSSSHTAGAARIGLTAYSLLGEKVVKADVGLHGSFAKTYRGHGTDRAIVGGLLGMHVDDPRLRDSLEIARQQGMDVRFEQVNLRGAHPNTVRLHVTGERGTALTLEAASVGGGNIEIHRINGLSVNFTGKADTMIIHHIDMPGAIAAVTTTLARHRVNIANMQVYRRKLGGDAMMVLELDGAPPRRTWTSSAKSPISGAARSSKGGMTDGLYAARMGAHGEPSWVDCAVRD